jgi:hypothetical protein
MIFVKKYGPDLAALKIYAKALDRLVAQRNQALLLSFSQYFNYALLPLDILNPSTYDLGHSASARPHKIYQCVVALFVGRGQ